MGIFQLNKKISIESLSYDPASTSSDGQVSPVQNLMKDLKQEIEAKDLLLKDKTEMISCLECQIADREKVIRELKKRNELSDEEQRTSDEMVLHLRKAVTAHAESIKFLLKEKEHFENDVASLQEQLRAMDESTIKLSEEKKQLENELKRSGDLVETLNFNISIISDQLSDCYNENMYKERQLVLLKDSNVELRGDIYKLQQDFQVMRDILQVQSYKSQLNECKKTQLEALQTEYEQFQEQSNELRNSINAREKDLSQLNYFRQKCAEMDIAHSESLRNQQANYGQIVKKLHFDINSLQEELSSLHDEHSRSGSLLRDAGDREVLLHQLEEKNDALQKSLEAYENKFLSLEQEVGRFEFENKTLTADSTKLQDELKEKIKNICEIRCELQKMSSDYNSLKCTCKCAEKRAVGFTTEKAKSPVKRFAPASVDSQINDLHRRLSQKSLEATKSMEMLKRRALEFEKQKKQASDENKRLVNDCIVLVDSNSELRNKINLLELNLEQVKKELNRKNEKLRISESRDLDREEDLQRHLQQLEDMRQSENRLRKSYDILTEELERHKQSHYKRDQNTLTELKQALATIRDNSEQLAQMQKKIAVLSEVNKKLTHHSDLLSSENAALKTEMLELKGQLAVTDGRKDAVSELLKATQEEVVVLQQEVQRLKILRSELEAAKQEVSTLKTQNSTMLEKHHNLQTSHQQLIDNYERLVDTRKFAMTILKVGKKMKSERLKRDNFFVNKIKAMTKHIQTLLADRQELMEQVQNLHSDNVILVDKLEGFYRYHDRYTNPQYCGYPPQKSYGRATDKRPDFSNLSSSTPYSKSQPELHEVDSLSHLIEVTTTKIRSKRKNWENDFRHSALY